MGFWGFWGFRVSGFGALEVFWVLGEGLRGLRILARFRN